jgi:hypothetical protein
MQLRADIRILLSLYDIGKQLTLDQLLLQLKILFLSKIDFSAYLPETTPKWSFPF